jgi:phage terminase large subunit GpA-like protein
MADVLDVRRRALAALRPPPRLKLSEWIERSIALPDGVSATPGPMRLWPYQREIADAIGDPAVERVTLVKPVRQGYTTLLSAAVGAFVANDPSPILVLQPTESDARDFVVSEIEPIFAASPVLAGTLQDEVSDTDRNTLLHRRFAGGSLKVVAAKAPRNLRRHTARVLFVDEADGMETTPEGDPILLAERRTLSFPDRKVVVGSTPTFEDTSTVLRLYAASDMRIFEVPCPECGGFTEILWQHIEWREGRPETAAFRCPHCAALVEERHKPGMVAAGRWRATAPEVKGHAGFRLNALVSLLANASWPKLAAEFLGARHRPELLQAFCNTLLAEGWREAGDEVDEVAIADRPEPFGLDRIPGEVLALTAGVDVQRDRLEATVIGWTADDTMLVLGHQVLFGDPLGSDLWHDLDELLTTRWRHPLGGKIGIDAAVVDAGDGATMDSVVRFCTPRAGRRIMAGKGVAGARQALATGGKTRHGRLWLVGVDGLKSQLFARLQGTGRIRFSSSLEPEFYVQLASERRVVRYSRGRPTARWERIPGRDAEALDSTVYAMAAKSAVTINPESRLAALRGAPAASPSPRRISSRFMERT